MTGIEPYRPPSALVRAFRRALQELGWRTIPLEELAAKYGDASDQYVEVDGTRIHYRVEGDGPALFLLHGVLAQLQTWDGWVERLRRHYRIVRFDLPGFGLTGPLARGDYEPEYAVELMEKTRAALGFEHSHLAGNSLGGLLSWYYAVRYPHRVDKLILIDPLSYPQRLPLLMRFSILPLVRNIARRCVPRIFVAEGVRQVYGDRRRITREVVDRYHELLLREGNRAAMIEYFLAAERNFGLGVKNPLSEHIARLSRPVLLMWGERDRWLPVSHVERFKRDVPHAQVKIYPGAGHIPMEEIPDQTAADAHAFLSGQ